MRGQLARHRTTPVYDPPVLAGQPLWGLCSGGFYARRGDTIVLTSTGHCTAEGTIATDPDGTGVRGVFGPSARAATCDRPGKTCAASDMNYLVVAEDRIPWGRLNLVDMGAGGYRELAPGTEPLRCDDVAIGDAVEINGQGLFRTGAVAEKGSNDFPEDGHYFPCMIAAECRGQLGRFGRRGPRPRAAGRRRQPELRWVTRVHAARRGPGAARPRAVHDAELRLIGRRRRANR